MANPIVSARRSINTALEPVSRRLDWFRDHPLVRAAGILLVLVLAILYPVTAAQTNISDATTVEVFVLLALGLNVVVGYAGLLDLGYAAFFAIGAYTLALLASAQFTVAHHSFSSPFLSFGPGGIHVNFYLMIPIAALTAALCGVLFGAPTLRLRGDYLAIVTLGFGEIVPKVIQNLGPDNSFGWPNITNGVNRITGIDSPPDGHLFGLHWTFQSNDQRPWYYLGLIIIALSVLLIFSLKHSRLGRAWSAIREDEIAAAHMGINITRTRLLAFGIGAAFSGFGGLIEASRIGSVDATEFSFNISVTILVMVILGGMGSIPGAMIGAIILEYLDVSWLDSINSGIHNVGHVTQTAWGPIGSIGHWMYHLNLLGAKPLIYGLILLIMMLLRPQGLWPSRTRARELQPATSLALEEENAELSTARAE